MTDHAFDLVIRNGEVHDGDGSPGFIGDLAVKDGRIAAVGVIEGIGREEIDATGMVVTPGFVDIHTHYDGQVLWSDTLSPSSWHGVTTAVMGNCGVGFAPCRPEDRDGLMRLMEGVEDIPDAVMNAGLDWDWETFPEYLDAVDRKSRDIDVCALLPHAPLRAYVMGERAFRLEPAKADDVEHMQALVTEAIEAGAFGVSTSRTTAHQSSAGDYTPTLLARERELVALTTGMADAGGGILEIINEPRDPEVLGEYEMVRRAVKKADVRALFSLLQGDPDTKLWREVMKFADRARADGVYMRPVVAPRAMGVLMGLEGSQHPLRGTATYQKIKDLPLAERVTIMRDPQTRASMLSDDPWEFNTWPVLERMSFANMYLLGNPPDLTPSKLNSVAAIAERDGRTPADVLYDFLLEDDGLAMIFVPTANYADGDLRACEEMLANTNTVMGLGDGGAHLGFILDATFQTYLLTYWVKERGTIGLPEAIRRMTSDTADVMSLTDRGRIKVGLRADLNVIDMDKLALLPPYATHDLPEGGKRLLQKASGYAATIVAGQVVYRDGEDTGARPGRLVRSS